MAKKYEIDTVDRQILAILMQDARIPYLEIARKLVVSGGMVHQRIEKLKEANIIEGSKFTLNLKNLGYDVTVFLGVHLNNSRDLPEVIKALDTFPEVLEAHYTTGSYALLLKISTHSISDFHHFLINKIQSINSVQSTESFISMDQPISRDIKL